MTHSGVYDVHGIEMPLTNTGYWFIPLNRTATPIDTAFGPYRTPHEAHAADSGGSDSGAVVYGTLTIERVHSVVEPVSIQALPPVHSELLAVATDSSTLSPVEQGRIDAEYREHVKVHGVPPGWTNVEA